MKRPDGLSAIRESACAVGLACCDDERIGAWVRLLAASKPGGTLLHVCAGTGELAAWIAQGMDLASRLVTLIDADRVAETVTATIAQDLRVTVHRQDPDDFLRDVQAHRFDLIVHDQVPDAARIDAAWRLLCPGGLLMIPGLAMRPRDAAPTLRAAARTLESLDGACLCDDEGAVLAAKRTPRPEPVRRGGRRARRGDGTVTGLRARGE